MGRKLTNGYFAFSISLKFLLARIALPVCLLVAQNLNATSVISVSLEQMATNSELVFEGRVLDSQARAVGNSIKTFITFEIIDVIKGEYDAPQIQLSFAGGTVNGMTRRISEMRMPTIDEKGIYFVESLSRSQVHPLYGWSQGHLLLIKDAAGTERVTTSKRQPVMAIQQNVRRSSRQLSTDSAQGLIVENADSNVDGMSKSQFKQNLKQMLEQY